MLVALIVAGLMAAEPDRPSPKSGYPERAQRQGVAGKVILVCQADYDTRVIDNCIVESESPEGFGFGDAAVRLAEKFKVMEGATPEDGLRKGPRRIPFKFIPPE